MKKLTLGVCVLAVAALLPVAQGSNLPDAMVERELRLLRADKLALAWEAGTLASLTRSHHLTAWESHAQSLSNLRELVNRGGARLARLEQAPLTAAQRDAVKALRDNLAPVAAGTEALIAKLNQNRLVTRFPGYRTEAQHLVAAAEQSAKAADRAVEVALGGTTSTVPGD